MTLFVESVAIYGLCFKIDANVEHIVPGLERILVLGKVVPVARIDLEFDDPGEMIRTALKSLLPSISGNKEEMEENIDLILKDVGKCNLTIACTQTETGVSILFMKESLLEGL